MLLLCYDGSKDSQAAIDAAATISPGGAVSVLTVWEPFAVMMAHSAMGPGYIGYVSDTGDLDEAGEQRARELAAEGVERATAAGLKAEPVTRAQSLSIADAILDAAAELDAQAIVIGTRGLTGVKSVFLGSVSHAVLQHADRPVVVAPSAQTAEHRASHRRA